MKKLILLLITTSLYLSASGSDITGKWNGVLDIMGTKLRLSFNIKKTDAGYTSTMDSPDQKAFGIPVTSTSFENKILKISLPQANINYEGILGDDEIITGTFKQGGISTQLTLTKKDVEIAKPNRPQEPQKPYPYYCEDVTFENTVANITLAGTLTLPTQQGQFPVVVLITGSGTQNRDEELMGHKPFLVIADYLTRNGIGVLRFDDRGAGQSGGDPNNATSADLATDVESAVNYLLTRKEIDKKKIGLIGHSEGGIIAPMVAVKSPDINFIVMLAGAGIPGSQILLSQQRTAALAQGINESDMQKSHALNVALMDIIADSEESTQQLQERLAAVMREYIAKDTTVTMEGANLNAMINSTTQQYTSAWMRYFIKYDPAVTLMKVKCPVLALNGEKDFQVTPKENLTAIKKALSDGGNKKVTTIELPNLNHLFQECETGYIDEYGKIEQTFSPIALAEMLNWIKAQVK